MSVKSMASLKSEHSVSGSEASVSVKSEASQSKPEVKLNVGINNIGDYIESNEAWS